MKNVLVTGGCGFIGSHVVDLLIDNGYNCKVCSEFIENTEASDNEGYNKGNDGFKNKSRDIREDVPIIEKQMEYVNNLINNALIDEQISADLSIKVGIFKVLKRLCNLELLSLKDEIEMLNFLKSYNFISKNDTILSINNHKIMFAVLSCKLLGKITLGVEEPVYTIEVLKTSGERSTMFLPLSHIEVIGWLTMDIQDKVTIIMNLVVLGLTVLMFAGSLLLNNKQ